MRSRVVLLLILGLLISAPALAKEYIVGFKQKPGAVEELAIRQAGGKMKGRYRLVPAVAVNLPEKALEKMRRNPHVAWVEENIILTRIDPDYSPLEYDNAWGVTHIGSAVPHALQIRGAGSKVAILDSGIDPDHPDLMPNYREGWNFVDDTASPVDDSSNDHGTHVAGIIGAAGNHTGVIGVAPESALYIGKIFDQSGYCPLDRLLAALEWAVEKEVHLVNLSLGTGQRSPALELVCQAAYDAGVLIFAATGNNVYGEVLYPAAFDSVVAVAATDQDDLLAEFSTHGPAVELVAPGVDIYSTAANGEFRTLSGTSQATPHVTGVAALILSAGLTDFNGDGAINIDDLRHRLQSTATDLGLPGRDDRFGFGLVDAAAIVNGSQPPGESPTPTHPWKGKSGEKKKTQIFRNQK